MGGRSLSLVAFVLSLGWAVGCSGSPNTKAEGDSPDSGKEAADSSTQASDGSVGADTSTSTPDSATRGDAGTGPDGSTGTDSSVGADGTVGSDSGLGGLDGAISPDAMGWTGETNIDQIFEGYCSSCHGDQWSNCWNVQANEQIIYEEVSSGAMPRNGSLPPSIKTELLDWLEAGAPCTGPDDPPDAGGGPPPPPTP
jgi:hypothetical protein